MAVKTRKLNKKDFTKDGLRKLINRDIKEINKLSEQDLICGAFSNAYAPIVVERTSCL
jgi:hypothetical protein